MDRSGRFHLDLRAGCGVDRETAVGVVGQRIARHIAKLTRVQLDRDSAGAPSSRQTESRGIGIDPRSAGDGNAAGPRTAQHQGFAPQRGGIHRLRKIHQNRRRPKGHRRPVGGRGRQHDRRCPVQRKWQTADRPKITSRILSADVERALAVHGNQRRAGKASRERPAALRRGIIDAPPISRDPRASVTGLRPRERRAAVRGDPVAVRRAGVQLQAR